MGNTLKYFAYGSNMSIKRMRKRVKSAQKIDSAKLVEHKLMVHKISDDDSGKCDAYQTGDKSDNVIGIIYEIDSSERDKLDAAEGLHHGYEEKDITVTQLDGMKCKTFTYYATEIDKSLKPYDWYKEHVLRGAIESDFPSEYISMIKQIESVPDLDREREKKEMSIYDKSSKERSKDKERGLWK